MLLFAQIATQEARKQRQAGIELLLSLLDALLRKSISLKEQTAHSSLFGNYPSVEPG
jgi:hypothetical protein